MIPYEVSVFVFSIIVKICLKLSLTYKQLLRNFSESPQLPSGYPGMLVLALFPPIFFWIMNPLVKVAKIPLEELLSEEKEFQKSAEWLKAERVAKIKMVAFTTFFLATSTLLLNKMKLKGGIMAM